MTLDMGFLETVDKIAGSLPKDLQFMVFSATIPQKLQPFLKKYLSNPVMEKIKTKTVISDTIDNWLISTKGRDKNAQIYQLTQLMQPYLAMIFVNTKTRADELHAYLTAQGLKVAKIHGDIAPRERKRIMNQVKNLDFEYIVATDLAARGIDIEGVSHVINDAIPQDLSFFVHRVGRTGRNGLPGTAITLYQPSDDSDIRELEKLGIKFVPKVVKDGEFQDTYNRDRRANREKKQDLVLIKDIEQELNITKSVASNLVKRMVQNGLVELEASPSDKRAKFVHLTEKSRSQMKQVKSFFDRIDRSLLDGVSEEKLAIFEEVMGQLQANVEKIGGEDEETR